MGDEVEELLPDVPVFCDLLRDAHPAVGEDAGSEEDVDADATSRSFVFRQLLLVARMLDWADEAGRQTMVRHLRA